jgi:hypothetical protein
MEEVVTMIANEKEGALELAVKMIAAPVWVPVYCTYVGCRKLTDALRKSRTIELSPSWMPANEVERSVYAALIIAGEPVNNRRLSELMGCSPGEASKRVARLEGAIRKTRKGREVLISLH